MSIESLGAPSPINSNPLPRATDEPIRFTHDGQQYTATYDADGGVAVSREDGITMHFNAEQAAGLHGLPTQDVLFGAPHNVPNASYQGIPLGQFFDNPSSSAPESLW
jgi:hypothetical protein